MTNSETQTTDADRFTRDNRIGGAVLMGGLGAVGGGLLGAKVMTRKAYEDYKADRQAWSQRKQLAKEFGRDTREIDREAPAWVLPYLKAALKGGLVGRTLGGFGGARVGAMTGPALMQHAAKSVPEQSRQRMREESEKRPREQEAGKTSSVEREDFTRRCFDYALRRSVKDAGFMDTMTGAAGNAFSKVRSSLQDREFIKKLLRATILGAGGAAVGGLGGSLLKSKGISYDQYGRPKRKSRAGLGALAGGTAGAAVGLLANPKLPYENMAKR